MNAHDILKYGHRTVLQAITDLPEDAWEAPGVCGIWSTKDIIAHLASYERVLVDILGTFLGSDSTPNLDLFRDPNRNFNDQQVALRKHHSVAETLAEYTDTCAQAQGLITGIPAETLRQPGTLLWYGAEYALDDLLVYMYYGHKREHSAQIAVFRDRLAQA
jgi:uncharacterized damage-inducible protein DinB